MITTVRELIHTHHTVPRVTDVRGQTSIKPWTADYHDFSTSPVTVYEPTTDAINEFLGPMGSSNADDIGLDTAAFPLNIFPHEISSEGDVTMDFDQQIAPCVAGVFSGNGAPLLWPRSQIAPAGEMGQSVIIDYQLSMFHSGSTMRSLERPVIVGDMKKPFSIRGREWTRLDHVSSMTVRLQKELRGYAYKYDCPQVFIFDTKTLVIVQFRARDREHIKCRTCRIDCCVIPREFIENIPHQCTMQYALYKLAWRGWVRLCATLGRANGQRAQTEVKIYGCTREYGWWSGEPFWIDHHTREPCRAPRHIRREFYHRPVEQLNGNVKVGGFWVWVSENGMIVDDTEDCFT